MRPEAKPQQEGRSYYSSLETKVWLESELVRSWLVADPELFSELLRSPDMELVTLTSLVDHIELRTGQELLHLRHASKYIPIVLTGEDHAELRRALALYLSKKAVLAAKVLPAIIENCLAPLQRPGRVDIHGDVIQPLIHQFISLLVGKDIPKNFMDLELLMIFFWSKSPSHLIELNRQFGVAFNFLEADCVDEMDLACKICCLTFGRETLGMMLLESVIVAFSTSDQGNGAKLPEFPSETGVPMTWRRAKTDKMVGGCPVRAGDNVKLKLQVAAYSERSSIRNVIFGAGPHSCVGKQISLVLWDHFATAFNAMKLRGSLANYDAAVEPHGTHYKKVEVEIL